MERFTVVKKPRPDKFVDRPCNFQKFDNLHLELLENKKKLKAGLPPVVCKPPAKKPKDSSRSDSKYESSRDSDRETKDKIEVLQNEEDDVSRDRDSEHSSNRDRDSDSRSSRDRDSKSSSESKKHEYYDDDEYTPDEQDLAIIGHLSSVNQESSSDNNEPGTGDSSASESKPAETPEPVEEEEDPYAGLSPEEREEREREEYLWRFRILKRKYRGRRIPEFNEHSDVKMMKRVYEREVKEIQLDGNVESYKMYLMMGVYGIELFFTNMIGVNFGGFAESQLSLMHQYDPLLVELGEREYNKWSLKFPVEVRLAGLILIQAAAFYILNVMGGGDKKDNGALKQFVALFSGAPEKSKKKRYDSDSDDEEDDRPRKKMKEPDIDIDNF